MRAAKLSPAMREAIRRLADGPMRVGTGRWPSPIALPKTTVYALERRGLVVYNRNSAWAELTPLGKQAARFVA